MWHILSYDVDLLTPWWVSFCYKVLVHTKICRFNYSNTAAFYVVLPLCLLFFPDLFFTAGLKMLCLEHSVNLTQWHGLPFFFFCGTAHVTQMTNGSVLPALYLYHWEKSSGWALALYTHWYGDLLVPLPGAYHYLSVETLIYWSVLYSLSYFGTGFVFCLRQCLTVI